jgi:putative DNA-invertase from lambdoid prophage Rac
VKVAIAYLRVSTREQSTDSQKMFLEKWAAENDYTIERFYDDTGLSGITAAFERPSFKAMMRYLRNNHVDAVLVFEVSRIGRSFWDSLEVIKQVDAYAPLIACSPKEKFLQTVDPNMRELLISIFSWVAEREREVMIERIKAGIAKAKAQGVEIGPRRKVLDWQLYQQLTDEGRGVEDIAARLGVSKPTLYEHLRRRLKEYGQR